MRISCIFDNLTPRPRSTTWLQLPTFGSTARRQMTRTRSFMTNTKLNEGIAAPEINFDSIDHRQRNNRQSTDVQELKGEKDKTLHARVMPESRSYFTVQPNFTDTLISFDEILENNQKLPTSDPRDAPKVAWLSGREYKNMIGEKVKNSRYQQMLQVIKRLNQIHPAVMPSEVEKALETFKRDTVPEAASTKISPIDGFGRSLGVGRRKTSTARAWLVEGTGEVLVNGKTLSEAFGRIHDRETVIWPLKATMRVDKYNLWCRVQGGGTTGQAESLTLAVAKALLGHEPALKPALRRAGCVTRDPRKVERKKPGHVKARKMPAWVKR